MLSSLCDTIEETAEEMIERLKSEFDVHRRYFVRLLEHPPKDMTSDFDTVQRLLAMMEVRAAAQKLFNEDMAKHTERFCEEIQDVLCQLLAYVNQQN